MATWRDAVQEAPGGFRLLLEVSAGAKAAQFPAGSNPWRQGRIGIRVRAPALEGRANAEVLELVAQFFEGCTATLLAGAADPRKTVLVERVPAATALRLLSPHLEKP